MSNMNKSERIELTEQKTQTWILVILNMFGNVSFSVITLSLKTCQSIKVSHISIEEINSDIVL